MMLYMVEHSRFYERLGIGKRPPLIPASVALLLAAVTGGIGTLHVLYNSRDRIRIKCRLKTVRVPA